MRNRSLAIILPVLVSLVLVIVVVLGVTKLQIASPTARKDEMQAVAALDCFAGSQKDVAYSWGVAYNKDGSPQNPEGSECLLEHGGIYLGDTTKKEVYLTFDLGYEAGYTAEVLDILKQHNIKAVFFLCGHYLREAELVSRMINEGHLLGNHTDKHKDLPSLSNADIKKDIADFDILLAEKYPQCPKPSTFRPPQGRFCKRTLKAANEQGLKTVMWSIAIRDWGKEPINPVKSAETIFNRAHNGAIILLHISNSGTPKMLVRLLEGLGERGFTVGVL